MLPTGLSTWPVAPTELLNRAEVHDVCRAGRGDDCGGGVPGHGGAAGAADHDEPLAGFSPGPGAKRKHRRLPLGNVGTRGETGWAELLVAEMSMFFVFLPLFV